MRTLFRTLALLTLLVACGVATTALAAADFADALRNLPQVRANPPFAVDSLLVKGGNQANFRAAGIERLEAMRGALSEWSVARIDTAGMSRSAAVDRLFAAYDALRRDPSVEAVTFNFTFHVTYVPDDPYAIDDGAPEDRNPDQFYLYAMKALDAWDITSGSSAVKVAVVDSGVAVSHPDLAAVIAGGYDFADGDDNPATDIPGDPGNGDGVDNNNDGYADAGVAHGTHVAGLIAGVMDNGTGIAGTAGGGTQILAVRVMSDEGAGDLNAIADGIRWAADNGADVINMSLGMAQKLYCIIPVPPDQLGPMVDAVNYAYGKGVAIVAASGNSAKDGSSCGVGYPAALDGVLAVGSSNLDGQRSQYSDFGGDQGQVDVTAYGGDFAGSGDNITITEAIWSTYVVSKAAADSSNGQSQPGDHVYAGALGTSMATPEVAGLAALVKALNPSATPDQVYQLIRSGADDIADPGYDVETGHGVVNFLNTVQAASSSTVQAD